MYKTSSLIRFAPLARAVAPRVEIAAHLFRPRVQLFAPRPAEPLQPRDLHQRDRRRPARPRPDALGPVPDARDARQRAVGKLHRPEEGRLPLPELVQRLDMRLELMQRVEHMQARLDVINEAETCHVVDMSSS